MDLPDVSRETSQRLAIYFDLLKRWNSKINLVAPATISAAPGRHFQDSLQLMPHIPSGAETLLDLGSGGGFPGLVIALDAAQTKPSLHVTLVEADQRKAAFLRTVIRETGVSAEVIAKRIEATPQRSADIISARALAPLPQLLQLSAHFLGDKTTCLFLKGRKHEEELVAAARDWHFTHEAVPSLTEAESALLILKDVRHA